MAITAGITGSNQTIVGASEQQFFSLPTGVAAPSTLMVRNPSTSTADIFVRIPALHGSGGSVRIPIGEKEYFRVKDGKLDAAYVVGSGATFDWGPVASTQFA